MRKHMHIALVAFALLLPGAALAEPNPGLGHGGGYGSGGHVGGMGGTGHAADVVAAARAGAAAGLAKLN